MNKRISFLNAHLLPATVAPVGTLQHPLEYTIQALSSGLAKPQLRVKIEKEIERKIYQEYNPDLGPRSLAARKELDEVVSVLEQKPFVSQINPELYEKILEYFPPLIVLYNKLDSSLKKPFLVNVHLLLHHHKNEKRKSGESYLQHLLEVGAGYAHAELREGIPNDSVLVDSIFRVMSVTQHDSIESVLSRLTKDGEKLKLPLFDTVQFNADDISLYEKLTPDDLDKSVQFATRVNMSIQHTFTNLLKKFIGIEGLNLFAYQIEDIYKERRLFTKLPGHDYPFYLQKQSTPHYSEEITKKNIEVVMGGKQPDQAQNNSSLKVFRKQENYRRIIKSLAKGAWGADMSFSYFAERNREEERTTRIQWYLTHFNAATGYRVSKKELQEFQKKIKGSNIGKYSKLERRHDLFTGLGGYEKITRVQQRNDEWGKAGIFHGISTTLFNMISGNITPSTQTVLDKVGGVNGYTNKEREFETYKMLMALHRWFGFYFAAQDYHLQLKEKLKNS